MNILLKMAFDGSAYHGFQVQDNRLSVCRVFQRSLEKILGQRVEVKGCSRTDRGVHATGYCISFKTDRDPDTGKLPLALNANLPPDIRVLAARQVPEDFHARYSAKGKEYTYRILNSHVDSPFSKGYYWRVAQKLDRLSMDRAASLFLGKQDFSSFMSKKSKITDCVRTVYSRRVYRDGDMVNFVISADGYLYNMVRIMTGTLINVGKGIISRENVTGIIARRSRSAAGPTAPAGGLFLTKVFYDFDF